VAGRGTTASEASVDGLDVRRTPGWSP
jgi:hypothetical protein